MEKVEIAFNDSVVTPFAAILRKLGEQGALWCTSIAAKSLINDLVWFSQAGRRGFDPRLPLHEINNLRIPGNTVCSNLLLLQPDGLFQRVDCIHSAVERRPGILILIYVNAVFHLISSNLRINPYFI